MTIDFLGSVSGSGDAISCRADGLIYAGIEWQPEGDPVVIAIHGWLDNALSFDQIAPGLSPCRVISLDLSGHGLSSWRSPDSTYNIWDDIPQLVAVVDQISSGPVIIMGHSRGAAIATILASILGDRCTHLVLIDGLINAFNDDKNTVDQLSRFVADRQKYLAREARFFDSLDDFVMRRRAFGFDDSSALKLASRALEQSSAGFRLRTDPRLHGASALWLSEGQRDEVYAGVTAPVLGICATEGLLTRSGVPEKMLTEAGRLFRQFDCIHHAGNHHLHMDAVHAASLADKIKSFLM
ncbi:MAG: alpha/beta fold hydrolase [Luminiphilus sp.]